MNKEAGINQLKRRDFLKAGLVFGAGASGLAAGYAAASTDTGHAGGNANFIGWDMINYPGVRTTVTPTDQQNLEKNALKPNHRSAYDTEMFTKATVSVEGMHHGEKA